MRITLVPALSAPNGWLEPYIPLGVLTVAGLLRADGQEVMVHDLNISRARSPIDVDHATTAILRRKADLVGFSTMAGSLAPTLLIARRIKNISPSTIVMLGGPQVTGVATHVRRLFPWIDEIHEGEAAGGVRGLSTASEPFGSRRAFQPESPPANDLIDSSLYPLTAFPYEVGRGCPFRCTFCSTSAFFSRNYRMQSPQQVVEGLRRLKSRGLDDFEFVHDLFTTSRRDAIAISKALESADLNVTWGCTVRSGTIGDADLQDMFAAGCRRIFIGLESGDARVRRVVGKPHPIAADDQLVRAAISLGIRVTVSFIIGFPEEDRTALQRTVDWALALHKAGAHVQLHRLSPLAGTVYSSGKYPLSIATSASDIAGSLRLSEDEVALIRVNPEVFPEHHNVVAPLLDSNEIDLVVHLFKALRRKEKCHEEFEQKPLETRMPTSLARSSSEAGFSR